MDVKISAMKDYLESGKFCDQFAASKGKKC